MVCLVPLMRTLQALSRTLQLSMKSSLSVQLKQLLLTACLCVVPDPHPYYRFASLAVRDEWLAARGKLRRLIQTYKLSQIYLSENLTKANRELLWMTRNRTKETSCKFVWVKNGSISIRKKEGDRCARIETASDLSLIN